MLTDWSEAQGDYGPNDLCAVLLRLALRQGSPNKVPQGSSQVRLTTCADIAARIPCTGRHQSQEHVKFGFMSCSQFLPARRGASHASQFLVALPRGAVIESCVRGEPSKPPPSIAIRQHVVSLKTSTVALGPERYSGNGMCQLDLLAGNRTN